MNRYLNGNPLPLLLEGTNPAVRYLTLRDIAGESGSRLESAYSAMRDCSFTKDILTHSKNGILGDPENFASIGSGSGWVLAQAVSYGLDCREPLVEKTIADIFSRWQNPDGGISGRWKPRHPDACLTGEILRLALLAGYAGEETRRAARWITDHQREDGGWLHCPVAGFLGMTTFLLFNRSGAGLSREADPATRSCIIATAACAMALSFLRSGDDAGTRALVRASEFLLSCRLSPSSGAPVTPYNSGLYGTEPRLGFPVFCQYDILYGLLCAARAGHFSDPRTGEPFNFIMMRQSPEGVIPYDNFIKGMLFTKEDDAGGGGQSLWTTLNFLRVLKSAGEL